MGYHVELTYSDVLIPTEKIPAAFDAVLALQKRDDIEGFYWGPAEFQRLTDLPNLFFQLRFEYETDDRGIAITRYYDKSRDEDVIFSALAPFIVSDLGDDEPSMAWTGEDGAHWRWVFRNGEMFSESGHVTYKSENKIEILVVRDPNGDTGIKVFIDGDDVTDKANIVDVDPGRGYMRSDWDANIEDVRNDASLSPMFRELAVREYQEYANSEYIDED